MISLAGEAHPESVRLLRLQSTIWRFPVSQKGVLADLAGDPQRRQSLSKANGHRDNRRQGPLKGAAGMDRVNQIGSDRQKVPRVIATVLEPKLIIPLAIRFALQRITGWIRDNPAPPNPVVETVVSVAMKP